MTHYKIKTAAGREFRVYSPNLPRMTFACGFALASMLSVLKMEGEGDEAAIYIADEEAVE